jgi:hypothetical protein
MNLQVALRNIDLIYQKKILFEIHLEKNMKNRKYYIQYELDEQNQKQYPR